MQSRSSLSAVTLPVAKARDILLQGELDRGLAMIEPASEAGDDTAAFMLAQVLAFQGHWARVRSLSVRLLKQPFLFDPYHEVMQLFALSAIKMGDWKEAKKRIASVRKHLESMLDMSSESNGYAEAFDRFEAYIWSEGRGKLPFRIVSPVSYASMSKDDYARLCSLSLRSPKDPHLTLSFDQLDDNRKHHYNLWKALYDQDLEKALELFHDQGAHIRIYLGETLQLAQLLMADQQDDYAWQILKPKIIGRRPILSHEVVWLELLWDPKTRDLMTPDRCQEFLTSDRYFADEEAENMILSKERDRLSSFCRLAGCLTEEAVAALETHLIKDADHLETRLKLIGAYSKYDASSLAKKKPHISWLIERYPDSQMIEDLLHYLFLDKHTIAEDFEEFKQKWLDCIEGDPNNTKILFNAALLLGVDDKALAEEMLVRAQTLEPDNVKFAERLYELNAYQVNQTVDRQRLLHAREALRQVAIIEKQSISSRPHTFSQLTLSSRLAWFSLEVGNLDGCRNLVDDMVNLARAEGFEQAYEFLGTVIQGRLALRLDEIDKAVQYMMSTLELEPFAHFRSDHPLLTLIAELAGAGQKSTVLEFFERSKRQWPAEETKFLTQFIADIEDGKAPYVPAVRL